MWASILAVLAAIAEAFAYGMRVQAQSEQRTAGVEEQKARDNEQVLLVQKDYAETLARALGDKPSVIAGMRATLARPAIAGNQNSLPTVSPVLPASGGPAGK